MRVLVAGAELAGHLSGFQIGFAYASLVDPQSGARNGVLSALYANLVVMVFLVIDGHHQLLQALAASYGALPIGAGGWAATGELAPLVARTLGTVFVIGLRIAAPVVLVLFIVEVALGLLSRVAPQLNLMVNAAPMRLFIGLAVLGATLASSPTWSTRRWRRSSSWPRTSRRRSAEATMSQERTEQPTSKRLRDARSAARSRAARKCRTSSSWRRR